LEVDSFGDVYAYGLAGPGFPVTAGAYQETAADYYDIFVSRLNNDLTILEASTYIGGADGSEDPWKIKINGDGNIVIFGYTDSSDFPTTARAYDKTHNGYQDFYVAILSSNLSNLVASTFIGGGGGEWYVDNTVETNDNMDIDSDGNIFIMGLSDSGTYPTTAGAYQEDPSWSPPTDGYYYDVVISKFSPDLSELDASTHFGSKWTQGAALTIDRDDNVIVGGWIDYPTANFPFTEGAYSTYYPMDDYGSYVSKLDNDLSDHFTVKYYDVYDSQNFDDMTLEDYLNIKSHSKKKITFEALIYSDNSESKKVKDNEDGGTGLRNILLKSGKDKTIRGDFEIKKLSKRPKGIVLPAKYQTSRCSVYRYLDINADFKTSSLKKASFKFQVKKQWIATKNITKLLVTRSTTKKTKVYKEKDIKEKDINISLSFQSEKFTGWWTIIGCSAENPASASTNPEQKNPTEENPLIISTSPLVPKDHPTIEEDIDHDGNMEESISQDDKTNNGYEQFNDPDGSTKNLITIDGDDDNLLDHFISTFGDSNPEIYWDPDDGIVSGVTVENVDEDLTVEYLFDSDGDKTLDRYYDLDEGKIKSIVKKEENIQELTVFRDKTKSFISQKQKVILPVSITMALLPFLASFFQIGGLDKLPYLFKETLFRLFGFLFMRRNRRKDWGTVYDVKTGKPIPLALVSVINSTNGNVKEIKMTDQYGSYYFLVFPGSYRLKVSKAGYRQLDHQNSNIWPTLYDNSYDFQVLNYLQPDRITFDIPMESIVLNQSKYPSKIILKKFLSFFFFIAFFINIIIFIINPNLTNGLILVGYLYFTFMKNFTLSDSKWGEVRNQENTVQPFAVVKLNHLGTDQIVARTITDESGRYYIIANRGKYQLQAKPAGERTKTGSLNINLPMRTSVKKKVILE